MAQVKEVEAAIDKDLAAGLITKGDAATQRAALNQVQSSYTDSKIGEILLTDNILEKTTTDTKSLDVLDKQAELISEIAQLDIAISVAQKQIYEETKQITPAESGAGYGEADALLPQRVWRHRSELRLRAL